MTAADTIRDLPVQNKRCPACGTGFGADAAFCPFDGIGLETSTWDPSRAPLTGTVVDNRYEVIAPLGEGGMGTVYKVRHITLDRHFALKVLRRDLAADAGLAARFLQEARATAAIHHPSVVAINDFGTLDDGAPYFVMELLVGETLSTRIRARGVLPPSEAASIAKRLADALSAAHAANVVHRDLKPENVFLVGAAHGKDAPDELRVVDFGAAKIVGASKLTRPGVVFGTPYYMSPEQASGQPVDARADVYSLGVLLYEMITGAVPFEADTYMGVLTKHMFAAPAKPSEKMPSGVQLGDLEEVVLRALEKDPAARYASMADIAAALEVVIEARPSSRPHAASSRSGRPLAFPTLSTADRIQRSVSRHVDEEQRRRRKTIAFVVISIAATIAMCGLAIALVQDAGDSKREATTAAAIDTVAARGPAAPSAAVRAPTTGSVASGAAPPVAIATAVPAAQATAAPEPVETPPPSARVLPAPPATPPKALPKPPVGASPSPPVRPAASAPVAPQRGPNDLSDPPDPWGPH